VVSSGSILQINVSGGGVLKRAIAEAEITPLGIAGDLHAHPQIHGGPLQAILLITAEGIDELNALGFPLFYGALGENITTRGLDRRTLRAGQRYRAGQAVIELTRIRIPCATLEIYGTGIQKAMYDHLVKAGDPASPRWGLSGFYASVLQPGTVRTGDPILLLDQAV
jgi:MOSC domain-containing protein YiiM